ncbi:MAG: molecular chaperone TorD family protein [Burkholderiales bacterium]|nr:molecular chaperone TorD family protein [Burkholderiales bacterium]
MIAQQRLNQELLSGEDWARADFYALLSNLFFTAPSPELRSNLAATELMVEEDASLLSADWLALIAIAKERSVQSIADEYDALFIGVGKADLMMFGSYHQSGFLHEKPLVYLRDDLQRLGLGRIQSVNETEDHLAFLCEAMRYLIVEANPPKPFSDQREFFNAHISSWVFKFLDELDAHPRADFYKVVGRLARSFFEIERQSFDFEV